MEAATFGLYLPITGLTNADRVIPINGMTLFNEKNITNMGHAQG